MPSNLLSCLRRVCELGKGKGEKRSSRGKRAQVQKEKEKWGEKTKGKKESTKERMAELKQLCFKMRKARRKTMMTARKQTNWKTGEK